MKKTYQLTEEDVCLALLAHIEGKERRAIKYSKLNLKIVPNTSEGNIILLTITEK